MNLPTVPLDHCSARSRARAILVRAGKPAVSDHVCRKYRREFAVSAMTAPQSQVQINIKAGLKTARLAKSAMTRAMSGPGPFLPFAAGHQFDRSSG